MKRILIISFLSLTAWAANKSFASGEFYQQVNLVSNGAVATPHTDTNLINPWGIAYSPTGPFWLSDNGMGVSTLYNGSGVPQSLVVTIPPPAGSTATAAPTGIVFNGSADFMNSRFIFATEDGTIASWGSADGSTAVRRIDNSSANTVYKGLAIGTNGSDEFLYAADFRNGKIDVFDKNFTSATLGGSFIDPGLPAGYAPFNIFNAGGNLLVSYALQGPTKLDDAAGPGNGFVNVFDTNGNLIKRLISNGMLNSPWGMTMAPSGFGPFSNDLLVGNFGDGIINAFDPVSGNFLGSVFDATNTPIVIDGLWGLKFGNGSNAGATTELFFSAGINAEADGLFGKIQMVPEPATIVILGLGAMTLLRKLRS
jgi:uncharacterized protein (TIGR03118 family)